MIYREEKDVTVKYKEEYVNGINFILKKRQQEAETSRDNYIKNIFKNQDKYREDFKKMLGGGL